MNEKQLKRIRIIIPKGTEIEQHSCCELNHTRKRQHCDALCFKDNTVS